MGHFQALTTPPRSVLPVYDSPVASLVYLIMPSLDDTHNDHIWVQFKLFSNIKDGSVLKGRSALHPHPIPQLFEFVFPSGNNIYSGNNQGTSLAQRCSYVLISSLYCKVRSISSMPFNKRCFNPSSKLNVIDFPSGVVIVCCSRSTNN